jgi:hypothetical protein
MTTIVRPGAETSFFERDPDMPLVRRATVEGVGTPLPHRDARELPHFLLVAINGFLALLQ